MAVTEAPPAPYAGPPPSYKASLPGPGWMPTPARRAWAWLMRNWRDRPLWMLIPAGVAVFVVVIVPVCLTIWLSLLNVNVSTLREWLGAPFYGIRNFINAFTQPSVLGVTLGRSILISVMFSLLTTIIITPFGILAAFSVHRRFRFCGVARAIYLIPYVIPTFVTALIARVVFLNGTGLVDQTLKFLHVTNGNTFWLIGSNAYWAMQLVELWATWPFIYLVTLAGLQSIPKEHYEAAALDGASKYQRLRYVVFPGITNVLLLGMLLSTLFHFGNFTLAFVMFSSPPPPSVEVLPVAAYYNAFDFFNFGVAAAIAVVTMVILTIPGYLYLRATRLAGQVR
jgi:multiple sugar transport system permease protein